MNLISMCTVGDPDGFPVVFHNGTPCSRLLPPWWGRSARERNLRVLCFDRPGYGNAKAEPGRTVASEVQATAKTLDALGVGEFATWGASGGGVYALGCGALLGDRVVAVACVAGNPPLGEVMEGDDYADELRAIQEQPVNREPLLRAYEGDSNPMRGWDLPTLLTEWDEALSPPDKAALRDGETGEYLLAAVQEAIRPGFEGWLDDNLAYVSPWGFELADLHQPVSFWHGDEDLMTPVEGSRTLAGAVPNAELFLIPEMGHPSLCFRNESAIMDWLVSVREPTSA